MATLDIAQKMREQRRRWFELDEPVRRALWIERPSDSSIMRLRDSREDFGVALDVAKDHIVGWRGFTEADLLGASQGSDTPVPFTRELLHEWSRNQADHLVNILAFASDLYRDSIPKEDVRKN